MCCNNTTQQLFATNNNLDTKNLLQNIQVAKLSIFAFVFVLGIWGNIMVIATIFTQNRLRSPSNYFIANLAISDLGALCLSMPLAAIRDIADWPFGEIACRFISPLKDVFLHVSMITLTAIAVDRYIQIVHPFGRKLSFYKVKLIIALIWLVDYLLISLPMAFIMKVLTIPSGLKICAPQWSPQHRRIAVLCLASFIILFLFVTAFAYLGVGVALTQQRKRIVQRAKESNVQEKTYRRQLEKNAKTIKVMIAIVVAFWFSALPLTVFALLMELRWIKVSLIDSAITLFITFTLLFLQNCVNPIILYVLSKEMRTGFAACAQCCPKYQQQMTSQPRHYAVNGGGKVIHDVNINTYQPTRVQV